MAPGCTSTALMAACSRLCDEGRERLAGSSRPTASRSTRTRPCSFPMARARCWCATASFCPTPSARAPIISGRFGESEVGPSPADLSPELTRHFRALRLWLPLQIAGVARLPRGAGRKARARPLFPRAPVGDRRLRPRAAAGSFGRRLPLSCPKRRCRRIQPAAAAASSAGRPRHAQRHPDRRPLLLRCAILCFRTHVEHVDDALDTIRDAVRRLDG